MISVCIATYNGGRYIGEQLASILPQLTDEDEVVISDDGSTDDTLRVVAGFADKRIRVFTHEQKVAATFPLDRSTHNFANAMKMSCGEYIFLSDQDDVWLPGKVEKMMACLQTADWVLSDCRIVDQHLNVLHDSIFELRHTRLNILPNLWSACYQGCCMAFRRCVLERAWPFPVTKVGHDLWLGLVARLYFRTVLLPEPLLLYRKHGHSVTPVGAGNHHSLGFKIYYRLFIVKHLCGKWLEGKCGSRQRAGLSDRAKLR